MQCSSRFNRHSKWLLAFALFVLAFKPSFAQADYLFTASQTGSSSPALDAEAYFALSGDTLTITLTNLQSSIVSAGQAISGLQFSVSNPPVNPITGSSSSVTLTSVTGNVVQINSGSPYLTDLGNITYSGSTGSNTLSDSHWAVGTTNGLTALSGAKPDHLILGPGDGSSFNSSIFQHQPDFQSSAIFVLTVPGMESSSTISNVTFYFGTSSSEPHLPGSPGPGTTPGGEVISPAPSSAILFSLGGLALVGFMARSRRRLLVAA